MVDKQIEDLIQQKELELQRLRTLQTATVETTPPTTDPLQKAAASLPQTTTEETIPKSEIGRYLIPQLRLITNLCLIAMAVPVMTLFCGKFYLYPGLGISFAIAIYAAFIFARTITYQHRIVEKYNIPVRPGLLTRLLKNKGGFP